MMSKRLLTSMLLFWLLIPAIIRADEATIPVRILQQDQGRDYGVMVGDLIQHRYLIEADKPYAIIQSSLPQPGDLDYWLTLRDTSLVTRESGNKTRYLLELTYQTFYAPLDVRALTIPAIQLDFSASQQRFALRLPDWQFTMSPIKEITPRGVGNENEVAAFMKPAIAPKPYSLAETNQKLLILGVSTGLLLLALLWINGLLPRLGQSPFAHAAKEIRRIKRNGVNTGDDYLACIQAVHQAINHRAGGVVFGDQLDRFLEQFPQFSGLKAELLRFFAQSRDAFFMNKQPDHAVLNECLRLCRQMAASDKVNAVK
jgi:mxaA protein